MRRRGREVVADSHFDPSEWEEVVPTAPVSIDQLPGFWGADARASLSGKVVYEQGDSVEESEDESVSTTGGAEGDAADDVIEAESMADSDAAVPVDHPPAPAADVAHTKPAKEEEAFEDDLPDDDDSGQRAMFPLSRATQAAVVAGEPYDWSLKGLPSTADEYLLRVRAEATAVSSHTLASVPPSAPAPAPAQATTGGLPGAYARLRAAAEAARPIAPFIPTDSPSGYTATGGPDAAAAAAALHLSIASARRAAVEQWRALLASGAAPAVAPVPVEATRLTPRAQSQAVPWAYFAHAAATSSTTPAPAAAVAATGGPRADGVSSSLLSDSTATSSHGPSIAQAPEGALPRPSSPSSATGPYHDVSLANACIVRAQWRAGAAGGSVDPDGPAALRHLIGAPRNAISGQLFGPDVEEMSGVTAAMAGAGLVEPLQLTVAYPSDEGAAGATTGTAANVVGVGPGAGMSDCGQLRFSVLPPLPPLYLRPLPPPGDATGATGEPSTAASATHAAYAEEVPSDKLPSACGKPSDEAASQEVITVVEAPVFQPRRPSIATTASVSAASAETEAASDHDTMDSSAPLATAEAAAVPAPSSPAPGPVALPPPPPPPPPLGAPAALHTLLQLEPVVVAALLPSLASAITAALTTALDAAATCDASPGQPADVGGAGGADGARRVVLAVPVVSGHALEWLWQLLCAVETPIDSDAASALSALHRTLGTARNALSRAAVRAGLYSSMVLSERSGHAGRDQTSSETMVVPPYSAAMTDVALRSVPEEWLAPLSAKAGQYSSILKVIRQRFRQGSFF